MRPRRGVKAAKIEEDAVVAAVPVPLDVLIFTCEGTLAEGLAEAGLVLAKGAKVYYEVTRAEQVSASKDIVLLDDTLSSGLRGADARRALKMSEKNDCTLGPSDVVKPFSVVFVHSKSPNRKMGGTRGLVFSESVEGGGLNNHKLNLVALDPFDHPGLFPQTMFFMEEAGRFVIGQRVGPVLVFRLADGSFEKSLDVGQYRTVARVSSKLILVVGIETFSVWNVDDGSCVKRIPYDMTNTGSANVLEVSSRMVVLVLEMELVLFDCEKMDVVSRLGGYELCFSLSSLVVVNKDPVIVAHSSRHLFNLTDSSFMFLNLRHMKVQGEEDLEDYDIFLSWSAGVRWNRSVFFGLEAGYHSGALSVRRARLDLKWNWSWNCVPPQTATRIAMLLWMKKIGSLFSMFDKLVMHKLVEAVAAEAFAWKPIPGGVLESDTLDDEFSDLNSLFLFPEADFVAPSGIQDYRGVTSMAQVGKYIYVNNAHVVWAIDATTDRVFDIGRHISTDTNEISDHGFFASSEALKQLCVVSDAADPTRCVILRWKTP